MNKEKFEAYLRDKLSILQEEEIDEILAEYLQHIDMRVAEGVSEEEAIADFGDLDELVDDLLDAYKINRNERDFARFENRVKLGLNKAMDFINRIANSIMRRSSNEVVTLIVEFLIVIFAVFLVNSFIEAIFSGVNMAFYFRPYFLTNLIRLLIGLIRVVLTTSVSLAIFYWFAKERVLRNEDVKDQEQTDNKQSFQKTKEATVKPSEVKDEKPVSMTQDDTVSKVVVDEKLKEDVEVVEAELVDEKDKYQEPKAAQNHEYQAQAKPMDIPKPKKDRTFMQKVVNFNVMIIKIIVALCLIPAIVLGVFMGIGYVMLLIATISGYGSLGLVIMFSGIILIYYYFTILFIKFVGGKRA